MNTLAFDFDRANAPASNDPASVDRRELAAAFRRISIDDTGFDSSSVRRDRPLVPSMRIALLAPPVPGDTRYPFAQLRRRSVEALLGRLGIDPSHRMDERSRAARCGSRTSWKRSRSAATAKTTTHSSSARSQSSWNGSPTKSSSAIFCAGSTTARRASTWPRVADPLRDALAIEKLQQRNGHLREIPNNSLNWATSMVCPFFSASFARARRRARRGAGRRRRPGAPACPASRESRSRLRSPSAFCGIAR
jgi:hypothetical protein